MCSRFIKLTSFSPQSTQLKYGSKPVEEKYCLESVQNVGVVCTSCIGWHAHLPEPAAAGTGRNITPLIIGYTLTSFHKYMPA